MAEQSLSDVVARGDRLDSLIRLRDWIAERLEDTKSARDLASLTKQLADVLEDIEDLEEKRGGAQSAELLAFPSTGTEGLHAL